ncbi:MAG: LysR family transcriptional regulator [Clostridia bacterium]|nr:LysR family transcriptional regulator [Clostridia bacterium]
MHIENFEYFYQVAKAKSISKVAKNQHISQSALSQQIQKFEESLGVDLLERSNKGVTLTEIGQVVLKYSENIMRTYSKMQEEIQSVEENISIIKIQANYAITDHALPCTLYKVKEQYGYHKYELTSNPSSDIVDNIANDICDIGFINGDPLSDELHSEKVGSNTIVLISNTNGKTPDTIYLEDLFKFPLITLNDKYEIKSIFKKELQYMNYEYDNLNIVFETDSIEALKSSVVRGHGVGFIPYIAVKEELYRKRFKIVKIEDFNIVQDVYMISKKGQSRNKSVNEFIEAFKVLGSNSFC